MATTMTEERNTKYKSVLKASPSAQRKSERCNVSFFQHAQLIYIETVDELSSDEITSSYYQDYEYRQIKAGNKILTKKLKSGETCEETDLVCYRGLEHKTEEKSKRRRRSRLEAAMAVYEEQMRQQEEGIVDAEAIRDAYEVETYMSQEVANATAVNDAAVAQTCWNQQSLEEDKENTAAAIVSDLSMLVAKTSDHSSIGSKSISPTNSSSHFKGIVGLVVRTLPQRAR